MALSDGGGLLVGWPDHSLGRPGWRPRSASAVGSAIRTYSHSREQVSGQGNAEDSLIAELIAEISS
jgi:hypothetical protein